MNKKLFLLILFNIFERLDFMETNILYENGTVNFKNQMCANFENLYLKKVEKLKNLIYLDEDLNMPLVRLELQNFNSLSSLNFSCITNRYFRINGINFYPKEKIILKNLEFNFLIKNVKNIISLNFVNLKGIDLDSYFLETLNYNIGLYFSEFLFYKNSQLIDCNNLLLLNKTQNGIFKNIYTLTIAHTVKYIPNTCPLIFQNSNITNLQFYGLADNFIQKNILSFSNLNKSINLNSYIFNLQIEAYYINLTNTLLDPLVFKNLEEIIIKGSLKSMDTNLFKNLLNLNHLKFETENFRHFISQSSEWMKYLNERVIINKNSSLDQALIIDFEFKDIYYFPDEDFCYFKNFPTNKLVFTYINPARRNCTCLVSWLTITNQIYNEIEFKNRKIYFPYENEFNFCQYEQIKCEFEKKLALCDKSNLLKRIEKKNPILTDFTSHKF